ncbi:MAG: squalene/phytoene synthase family protein [Nitrospiraceae bacterium]|jgi:squalene synthase HpnC|nr:squalene/phytoene synthase family protein [Nitrospiraceae bacterium]
MISLEDSFSYCKQMAESHYENFPVASGLLPKSTRLPIAVIYAFARTADDFADEIPDTREAFEKLSMWRELLFRAASGPVDHPVFRALSEVISSFSLPVEWLDHLIRAFERDRVVTRHQSFVDLLGYSKLSANPVGRLLLWVHGYRDEALFKSSDAICTALQLANFWQDIDVDRKKDRIYVPTDELSACHLSEDELFAASDDRHLKLLKRLESFTGGLFYRGRDLPPKVGFRLSIELRLVLLGGLGILKMGCDPARRISERPVLRKADWLRIFGGSLLGSDPFGRFDHSHPLFQEGAAYDPDVIPLLDPVRSP